MRSPPPRDSAGNVLPHNHDGIPDDFHVIRHITPNDLHPDQATGIVRVQSGAYSESSEGGMSVDIEEWMIEDGLTSLHYVHDPSHGATRLRVGDLRAQGLQVGWDPIEGINPHHGGVWGIGNGSKRKRKVRDCAVTVRKVLGET